MNKLIERQHESHRGAFFTTLENFDFTVVLAGDFTYQSESKPCAAHGSASGFVHAEERREDFLLVFRRDSDSSVGDFYDSGFCFSIMCGAGSSMCRLGWNTALLYLAVLEVYL